MKTASILATGAALCGALLALSTPAAARDHIGLSIGIGVPAPIYAPPPPVYYAPPPPVYYAPRVVEYPAPVYYGPRGYWDHRAWERREWERRHWEETHRR